MEKKEIRLISLYVAKFIGNWGCVIATVFVAAKTNNYYWLLLSVAGIIITNLLTNPFILKIERGEAEEKTDISSKESFLNELGKEYNMARDSAKFFQSRVYEIFSEEKAVNKMSEEEFREYVNKKYS